MNVRESGIKCIVWDLDNTIWNGTLLEDKDVHLRAEIYDFIRATDNRGILHSVASKNDRSLAIAKLEAFGLKDFFLVPQIGWSPKSGGN